MSARWACGPSSAKLRLPARNSIARYWYDWNPDELPRTPLNSAYSAGVSVANTDHCSVKVA